MKVAIGGVNVDASTFRAQLNGLDVTTAFAAAVSPVDLQASFTLGKSPLRPGSNELVVSISGVDPKSGGPAVGIRKVMFVVNQTIPGDINADGIVDCSDVGIVEASFGARTGQRGFDARADVNKDGVVDGRDLMFVVQNLPSGTACPPSIASLTATPNVLWPPNHKMVTVSLAVTASDPSGVAPTCSIAGVSSNEPTSPGKMDWTITGPLTVQLRAERNGSGSERVYTITVSCTNVANFRSSKTVTVTVPHDQGHRDRDREDRDRDRDVDDHGRRDHDWK